MKLEVMPLGPVDANTYILTDDITGAVAVIDCGRCSPALLEKLNNCDVQYILLTHGHFDHILGVYDLKKNFPNAKIVISQQDSLCLTSELESLAIDVAPGYQKYVVPDIIVNEGDKIEMGSLEFTVMHTPGHTKGSVCYLLEQENCIFTGDTLFCLTTGRTDLKGGNDDDMEKSIRRIYDMDKDYAIFPGHNRDTTLEYEKRRNRFMRRFK
ncbi:MAG: MBL fold metallo-hydrolase [Ruminococcus sp.]|nr:MBL fold metallo-hydrolase [Candidatus Copronaster equi]